MRKYFYLFFLTLFTTMSFTLTSCGDDNDEPNGGDNGNIVGTWKVEVIEIDNDWWQVDYIRFNESGTYESVSVVSYMGEIDTEKDYGTWSKKGNKLTIDGKTGTIKELSGNKLVLYYEGITITYKKCADSELDRYLN